MSKPGKVHLAIDENDVLVTCGRTGDGEYPVNTNHRKVTCKQCLAHRRTLVKKGLWLHG